MSCLRKESMARKLKFGSAAWREKYMKKNRPKRKKRSAANTYTRKGARAKRKRLKEMIREPKPRKNPPERWMKVKAVRVVKRGGRRILEIKR